ncbi:hypothetical protein QTP70_015784, partial [Hemibagrus guttatus]
DDRNIQQIVLMKVDNVYRLSNLFSGHGEPVPISGVIGHQGRIHPGQSANPSQGTHTLSFTHAITHTTDNLEMPINLPCMSLDQGRKPPRHRENMQTPHTQRRQESNPQPWSWHGLHKTL